MQESHNDNRLCKYNMSVHCFCLTYKNFRKCQHVTYRLLAALVRGFYNNDDTGSEGLLHGILYNLGSITQWAKIVTSSKFRHLKPIKYPVFFMTLCA